MLTKRDKKHEQGKTGQAALIDGLKLQVAKLEADREKLQEELADLKLQKKWLPKMPST